MQQKFLLLIELPVYNEFIYCILSLLKILNNDNIEDYDIENNIKLNKDITPYLNTKNKLTKYIKEKINKYYNEIESTEFIKLSYNNLYNKLFLEYIFLKLSSSNNNIQFKITPPQLIDANATTGISIKLKNINIVSETDKNSTTCNYFLSIFFKITFKIYILIIL